MWILSTDGFVSIVQHWNMPETLMVRARAKKDLLSIFAEDRIVETPEADYRFRVLIPKREMAEILSDQVLGINYPNFKNEIGKLEIQKDKLHAYHQIWSIMYDYGIQNLKNK